MNLAELITLPRVSYTAVAEWQSVQSGNRMVVTANPNGKAPRFSLFSLGMPVFVTEEHPSSLKSQGLEFNILIHIIIAHKNHLSKFLSS